MTHYLKTLLIYFYLTQTNSFTIVFKKNYNNLLNSRKNTAYQEKSSIPDVAKRHLMNSILLNSIYASCGPLLYGYLSFFMPQKNEGSSDGLIARDKNGNDINSNEWLKDHPYPSRELAQGLKGDPYYLITASDNNLEKFALNAICTHLGCVVPWNVAEGKYMCPCHGSQYNSEGKVIRGPAPKSLALATVESKQDRIILNTWNSIDFRTNEEPWWI